MSIKIKTCVFETLFLPVVMEIGLKYTLFAFITGRLVNRGYGQL